jgi:hypothetical protein
MRYKPEIGGIMMVLGAIMIGWSVGRIIYRHTTVVDQWGVCESGHPTVEVRVIVDGVEWKTTTVHEKNGACLFEAVAP